MFNSTSNKPTVLKVAVTATFIAALAASPLAIAQEHEHGAEAGASKEVTGEVIDMMCYVDHNASVRAKRIWSSANTNRLTINLPICVAKTSP